MSSRPLLPASSARASDALEEAQFRARMARVGPVADPVRGVAARRRGSGLSGPAGSHPPEAEPRSRRRAMNGERRAPRSPSPRSSRRGGEWPRRRPGAAAPGRRRAGLAKPPLSARNGPG
ncbi:hypothetical protein MOF8_04355 [Methylobacterium oryzae]